MISKKRVYIFLLVLIIMSICISSAVCAQDLNSTDEMKMTDDTNLEINQEDTLSTTYRVSGNTFEDIQKAVDGAKNGDTISLSGKYSGKGSMIKINKTLTIEGNGATLDGNSKSKMFEITGNYVSVNNITFINGKSASAGAIDWWSGLKNGPKDSYGVLTNCKFYNCEVGAFGGAVYFYDNKLTMENCYFENNKAGKGGGVYINGNDCVVENCKFISNSAENGGAIFCDENAVISNCNFETNTATSNGGAIYSTKSTAVISKSNFKGNSAKKGKNIYLEAKTKIAVDSCSWNVANPSDYTTLGIEGSFDKISMTATSISVPAVSGTSKSTQKITATVKDKSNNPVNAGRVDFKINEKTYSANVKNGKATIDYTMPSPSTIKASAKYIGSETYESSGPVSFNIVSNANHLKFTASDLTTYYNSDEKFNVKVMTDNGNPAGNVKVAINVYTGSNYNTYTETSNSNGVASFAVSNLDLGKHKVVISSADPLNAVASSVTSSIEITKISVKLTPAALSTTYGSGKTFQIKVVNSKTKNAIGNVKLALKVYTGKNYKTVTVTTNSNGYAKYAASTLGIGTHKVIASVKDKKHFTASSKKSSVTIKQATLTVSAPKTTNEYKKSQLFRVTVKNKQTGKAMKGVKVAVKVYTGSNYKIYNVKTDSNGIASINTKDLSKASHNVVISVKKTAKYKAASAKSTITIIKQKINTRITIENCFRYGGNNDALYHIKASLTDTNGKGISNKDVYIQTKIIIRGSVTASHNTKVTTDSNGVVECDINAVLGGITSYDVTVIFEGDSNYRPSTSESRYLN